LYRTGAVVSYLNMPAIISAAGDRRRAIHPWLRTEARTPILPSDVEKAASGSWAHTPESIRLMGDKVSYQADHAESRCPAGSEGYTG
jgi:biotin carboxylase